MVSSLIGEEVSCTDAATLSFVFAIIDIGEMNFIDSRFGMNPLIVVKSFHLVSVRNLFGDTKVKSREFQIKNIVLIIQINGI